MWLGPCLQTSRRGVRVLSRSIFIILYAITRMNNVQVPQKKREDEEKKEEFFFFFFFFFFCFRYRRTRHWLADFHRLAVWVMGTIVWPGACTRAGVGKCAPGVPLHRLLCVQTGLVL